MDICPSELPAMFRRNSGACGSALSLGEGRDSFWPVLPYMLQGLAPRSAQEHCFGSTAKAKTVVHLDQRCLESWELAPQSAQEHFGSTLKAKTLVLLDQQCLR